MSFIWIHHFLLFTDPISIVEVVENKIIAAISRSARYSISKPILYSYFSDHTVCKLCRIVCEVYVELSLKSRDKRFSR